MVTFPEGMVHELASLRRGAASADVPDHSRELGRRRRSVGDGARPAGDPVRVRALGAAPPVATDFVGRAIWKSADRARRLGSSIALVQDEEDAAPRLPPGRRLTSTWLAGFSFSAILLFLLGA